MHDRREGAMSRKDFLKRAAGILTLGFLGPESFAGEGMPTDSSRIRVLGRTGMEVTSVCLGATRTNEPSVVKAALDTGINFIDTGRMYANGQNEVMLGEVLKGIRKEVVIQSKMRVRLSEKAEEIGTEAVSTRIREMMQSSLDASLKALQTDYIDIMLFHSADSPDLLYDDTVLGFFQNAKRAGKIRAHGFSFHNQPNVIGAAGENPFYDVVMVPYNHKGSYVHSINGHYHEWDQPAVEVLLKKLHEQNTGIVAMKTCSAGPYSEDDSEAPSFRGAIKWAIDHSYIHSAAVAMRNFKEIEEDVKAMS